jgi:hypothetical protein
LAPLLAIQAITGMVWQISVSAFGEGERRNESIMQIHTMSLLGLQGGNSFAIHFFIISSSAVLIVLTNWSTDSVVYPIVLGLVIVFMVYSGVNQAQLLELLPARCRGYRRWRPFCPTEFSFREVHKYGRAHPFACV